MENTVISKPKHFEEIKQRIIFGGAEKLQVIADFDNTLTYAHKKDGKRLPSLISVLRDGDYISKEYAEKAHELFNKYHPKEKDETLSDEERKKIMNQWWNEHFDLLIKSGLNKKHLEDIVKSNTIKLRKGIPEMINYLHEKNIPLIILSSSGIGEALKIYLEKQNLIYENVNLISNFYNWDKNGNAISVKRPIIHGGNKDETSIREIPKLYEKLKNRKNVILLGDNKGDLQMSSGSKYENIIKIGFLNQEVEKNLENYKKDFDVVITNDSDAEFVFELIKKIK